MGRTVVGWSSYCKVISILQSNKEIRVNIRKSGDFKPILKQKESQKNVFTVKIFSRFVFNATEVRMRDQKAAMMQT